MTVNDAMKQHRRRFLQAGAAAASFVLAGLPLALRAADDAAALQIAVRLVKDAGFDPVVVGGLDRAKDFDYGTPIFAKPKTAAEARQILGIKSQRS
jgi:predicted dinucleotide-binding enzyme